MIKYFQQIALSCILIVPLTCIAEAGAIQTLRLDYYHTGDASQEIFSLDRVVTEPLAWPGSGEQVFDKLDRGKYRFFVSDLKTGKRIFSRSFSSVYGEWETTTEATKIKRSFHESLRFPKPSQPVKIDIEKRDAQHQFNPVWTIEIDPSDYLHHHESASYQDQVIAIEQNGAPQDKVDLLILGDGYTENDLASFIATARRLSESLFTTSPFKERRKDFNVWALAPIAHQSGVSRPSTNTYRDSPLGSQYDAFGSERYVLTYDNRNFRRIASSAPYDFVEILVNSETYGGGGIFGPYSTAAANNDWAEYLFIHEFGHHFAGLADEYFTSSVAYSAPTEVLEPYEPNVTALLPDEQLKWQHLVTSDTKLPTAWPKTKYEAHSLEYQKVRAKLREDNKPESEMNKLFIHNQEVVEKMFSESENTETIGAFLGANYSAQNFYRSEMNCLMFTRSNDFCQVCSNAIEDMINMYSNNDSGEK